MNIRIAAAGNLQQNLGQVAGVLNAIAVILFFGGLLMAAIMFMIGRTEYLKYGLVGSGVGGLAWVIVTTFFQAYQSIISQAKHNTQINYHLATSNTIINDKYGSSFFADSQFPTQQLLN